MIEPALEHVATDDTAKDLGTRVGHDLHRLWVGKHFVGNGHEVIQ